MKYLLAILTISLAWMNLACCSNKESTKDSPYKGMSLIAANAGGFTGISTGIKLKANGECSLWQSRLGNERDTLLFTAATSTVDSIFSQALAIGVDTMQLSAQANVVQLLEFRKDSTTHQLTWKVTDSTTPPALQQLFDTIRALAESQTLSPTK